MHSFNIFSLYMIFRDLKRQDCCSSTNSCASCTHCNPYWPPPTGLEYRTRVWHSFSWINICKDRYPWYPPHRRNFGNFSWRRHCYPHYPRNLSPIRTWTRSWRPLRWCVWSSNAWGYHSQPQYPRCALFIWIRRSRIWGYRIRRFGIRRSWIRPWRCLWAPIPKYRNQSL